MLFPEQPPIVDRATLLPLAQAATDCPNLQIDTWQTTLVSQQGRRRIVRFAGTGQERGTPRAWSLILKVIQAPDGRDNHDADMRDWAYWPRESLLYEKGIPQTLVGALRAPRCFGVVHPAPNLRWIWLEDLHDRYGGTWPLERYACAATHLGTFNGAYLMGVPLPRAPWLTDTGLRSRSAGAINDLARLRDPTLWHHPLLRHGFPRPVYADLERLAGERERFLAAETRLVRTFCHLDAWHGNMAAVTAANGADVTVLFDWALAGYGAPGAEISNNVWTSLLEFKLDIQEAERLEAAVLHSYLEGLANAGWHGDSRLVRCAYLISSVLLFGLVPEGVDHALQADQHTTLERQYGWPIEQLVKQAAAVTYRLLSRADELRRLLDSLSW